VRLFSDTTTKECVVILRVAVKAVLAVKEVLRQQPHETFLRGARLMRELSQRAHTQNSRASRLRALEDHQRHRRWPINQRFGRAGLLRGRSGHQIDVGLVH